ncbi:uncharacterized protein JCM6883_002398 [Sporobolomyces salmoneus]|uniref:uncharacterized protein n=1 Tax=Sporobolomyces salmoneus TaxID=183962 RepID=UPI00318198AF
MVRKIKALLNGWKASGKQLKPKRMMVEGNLGTLLSCTKHEEIWKEVEYLAHKNWDSLESLENYTEFPNLKTLSIHAEYETLECSLLQPESTFVFPHLERFELHCPNSDSDDRWASEWTNRPRPQGLYRFKFPKLRHLVLDVRDDDSVEWIREELGEWLLQIKMLDVNAHLVDGASVITILHYPELFSKNLKYLSLDHVSTEEVGEFDFFSSTKPGFDLDILFLRVQHLLVSDSDDLAINYIYSNVELFDRLGKIARQKDEVFKAARVVFYADWSKESLEESFAAWKEQSEREGWARKMGGRMLTVPNFAEVEFPLRPSWEDRFEAFASQDG